MDREYSPGNCLGPHPPISALSCLFFLAFTATRNGIISLMKRQPSGFSSRADVRWLVALLFITLAIFYLLPQLGELDDISHILARANPVWLVAAVLAALSTYALAAFALTGSTRHYIPWGQAFLIQMASTVLNRTTPKGVGSIAMAEQFLERRGLKRPEAAASVTLIYSAGVVMHLALLIATVIVLRPSGFNFQLAGTGQVVLVATILILALSGVLLLPRFKRSIQRWAGEIRRGLAYDVRHPAKLLQLAGGSAGITMCHVLGLFFALQALDIGSSFLMVMFVYLAGSVIASASPTPGGLGATEAALALGLTASGLPAGEAVAGVLLFRLISFWLPLLPGLLALRIVVARKLI